MAESQAPKAEQETTGDADKDALVEENIALRKENDALRAQMAAFLKANPQTKAQRIATQQVRRANAKLSAVQRFTDLTSRRDSKPAE